MIKFPVPRRFTTLILTAFAVMVFFGIGCEPQKQASPLEKITIAYSTSFNTVLVHIAFTKGYFKEEGLDAIPQSHTFGKAALQSVIEGKADIAAAADTPIMFAIMNNGKIAVLAAIQMSGIDNGIVAGRDRGIAKPSDLQGKKIGLTSGTMGDFFADSFLRVHGIDRKHVKIIDLKPDEMAAALSAGKVDAVSTWHPTLIQLQKKLGSKGIMFSDESLYTETICVVALQEYIKKNPAEIKKVLRALLKAETFVQQHPEETRRLVAEFIKTDKALLDEVWDIYNFRVTMDQTIPVNLENQTRWAIKHRLTARRDMPNYLDFIYVDGLSAVKPEAVRVIR
jgi:ABC-type nitrate/sulfonate/bicarbonate transport system substrate-binding protein